MQSSKAKSSTRSAATQSKQGASNAQAAGSSSKPQDPVAGWSIEEMFETKMDKDGNLVPDPISYVDGSRMNKGERGFDDESDMVSASLDDFD